MHEGVLFQNDYNLQNDSYWNLDNFSDLYLRGVMLVL